MKNVGYYCLIKAASMHGFLQPVKHLRRIDRWMKMFFKNVQALSGRKVLLMIELNLQPILAFATCRTAHMWNLPY